MPSPTTTTIPNATPRFRGQLLQKIYRVWLFRTLLPVLLVEVVALSVLLYAVGQLIFVERIVENATRVLFSDPVQIFKFIGAAFLHATLLEEVLVLALAVALAFLVHHLTQGFLRFILVRQNYFSKVGK